ncbi:MAG: sugar ABC transporter permease [Chloroflexi bacterium]|nr:sugar ABC transporter permease [Chloroflexota bacterium]
MAIAEISARSPGQPGGRWAGFRKRLKESRTAWLYILPAGLVMLFITVIPQLYQIWMSFTDYRVRNLRFILFDPSTWEKYLPTFVGLQNYIKVLTSSLAIEDYDFWRLLLFNVTWTVTNVAFHVVLGVLIALALNSKKLIGRRIYRALFVLPWAIPPYISALTWRNMYDDRFGAFNQLLGVINNWIGTSFPTNTRWLTLTAPPIGGLLSFLPLAYYCLLLANIWLGWPFMSVVATGALQSIPAELYEAASIDGASGWQKLRSITIPLLRPAMVPAIMLGTIWTFNQFNVIYFISQGGPFGRTEILVTQAYKLVTVQRLYGVAAAFGFVVFFVLLIFTLLQNRVTRGTEAYYV